MQVDRKPVPLHHYLKQPRRLVHALMNPEQVKELGNSTFRFQLKGIQFLTVRIRPVVDLCIDASQSHLLKVESVGCRIHGSEFIDQRFDLSLSGVLRLADQEAVTNLDGQANLAISVELPPFLQFTPQSILETTGNQILKGVLMTMKQRLMYQLAADYERWSAQQTFEDTPRRAIIEGTRQTFFSDS
jgi:hypothetical protein